MPFVRRGPSGQAGFGGFTGRPREHVFVHTPFSLSIGAPRTPSIQPTPLTVNSAATFINSIRDLIPDPAYDVNGQALPDADGGLFRAQTLYRWLDRAVQVTSQRIGWVLDDWFAMYAVADQPFYSVDRKWINVDAAFANQWPLSPLLETDTIFPAVVRAQPLWFGLHAAGGSISVHFYPVPKVTDPLVALAGSVSATDPQIFFSTNVGFLTRGYVLIDNEIIQYQDLIDTTGVTTLTRGACGTGAAQHNAGAQVFHLSLWIKGKRIAQAVTSSTSNIELPASFLPALENYVLGMCRKSENDDQSAKFYMDQYEKDVQKIFADPKWRTNQGSQVKPYGEPVLGPLVFGRVIVP